MSRAAAFLSPEVRTCPFDFYRELRTAEPISYVPDIDMYLVTTYDLILEVVKNPQIFSSKGPKDAGGARTKVNFSARANEIVDRDGFGRSCPTLVNNDPPSHAEYRKLVQQTFRVSRIRQMESYVKQTFEALLDRVADRDEFDAIKELTIPLPMYVIADQIGVAREDFEKFKLWSEAFIVHYRPPKPEHELIEAAELVVEAQQYIHRRMEQRRAAPQDDMISELVGAKLKDGRALTDKEIMSIVEQLLVAGNDTTTNGIGNGLLYLAINHDVQDRLRADAALIPQFVEEILRTESPVQGLVRTTREETVLGGVTIPENKTLMLVYASANRDETRFDHGEQLDLARENAGSHLAFGSGPHHCVGSELARVEMRVAFEAFLRRFPKFELAVPEAELVYGTVFANRGVVGLPLRIVRD